MRRTFIVFLFALAMISASAVAQPASRPSRGGRGGGDGVGGALVERIQQSLGDLKLSDEQKAKLEEILVKARDQMRDLLPTLHDLSREERQQRIREFVMGLREQVSPVLTDEQRAAFDKKLQGLRPGGAGNAGGAATSAPTTKPTTKPAARAGNGDAGAMLQRMRDAFAKLDLSADQKTKVDAIFADVESKFRDIRAQSAGDAQSLREKVQALRDESRSQLRDVLTPEQQEKLRGLMQSNGNGDGGDNAGNSGGGDGAKRERRNRERRRDGSSDAGNSGSMEKPDPPKSNPPATQPNGDNSKPSADRGSSSGAAVSLAAGQVAPALALKKLDGSPIQLSSLKGKIVLLAFGSYTSPSFRQRAEALEQLRKDFGLRVTFLIVYTKEAHPEGNWEVDRNRDVEIKVAQQKDEADRKKYAREAATRLNLGGTVAIDSMDDATATAYHAFPNNAAVLIGKDGNILTYQEWFDGYRMRDAILAAISEK